MGFGDLFSWVLDKIEKTFPLDWVYPWQRAVKARGASYKEVGPGVKFKIPWLEEFHKQDVVWYPVTADKQYLCSGDGKVWVLALRFDLRVVNVMRAVAERDEPEEGVMLDAMTSAAEWLNTNDSENINIEAFRADCMPHIQELAKEWGCEIKNLGLTDLAPMERTYCIVGQGGAVIE